MRSKFNSTFGFSSIFEFSGMQLREMLAYIIRISYIDNGPKIWITDVADNQ